MDGRIIKSLVWILGFSGFSYVLLLTTKSDPKIVEQEYASQIKRTQKVRSEIINKLEKAIEAESKKI